MCPLSHAAIEIIGDDVPLVVGNDATLTCSSDLDGTSVEWFYNGQVVVSSSGSQADLVFTPVNDSIHNRQYTCRVTTPYGTLDQPVTTLVDGNSLFMLLME